MSCSGRGGSRTRKAYRSAGFQPGPVAHRVALPFLSSSTPTRTRTRNLSLEVRDDCPFHHRGNDPAHSGGQGSRTLISTRENRVSSAARQPVIRLPSEITHQWTDRELNPDLQTAGLASSRWTISPCSSSGPPGTRTPIAWMQTKRLPLGPAALVSRGPSGTRIRSSSLPRKRAAENTYRPSSDPGWTRTITFLVVTQASSPLDHGIIE